MYESHWQLKAKPFEDSLDGRFYYPSEAHQGALLKLRYAIENRRGAALLSGAAGLGKTLLIQTLSQQLADSFQPRVHVVFPQMPAEQILAYLAGELTSETYPTTPAVQQCVRRIEKALHENAQAGKHAVIVLDEAHLLEDARSLETMRLLLNFQQEGQPCLTLLLVGHPSLLPTLDRTPELDERIAVKCLLRRFTLEETISYISHRMNAVGGSRPIFDQPALEAIHHLSHGVPRRINRLCDLALLVGFAEERSSIGASQVESVSQELVAVLPE